MKRHLLLYSLFIIISCNDQERKDSGESKQVVDQPATAITDTTACIFSEIVYCPNPQQRLDQYLPKWKVVWDPQAVGGNYAFVASDGNTYAIAFRGSLISFTEDAFSNWIYNDLNIAVQDKWPYCGDDKSRISQGSYIGWQNLEKMKDKITGKSLWDFLSSNVKDQDPLLLTGHSLGGNLATVYASWLWWKFNEAGHPKNNINVVTFAAPAPGNASFAEDFDKKFPVSLRVENTNDIVPKFPCSKRMIKLGSLYSGSLSAGAINVGYKNLTITLSSLFDKLALMINLLELQSDFSGYLHTNSDGKLITIPLSGKNDGNSASSWFAEAGYQHGMAQYAVGLGAPIIICAD